MRILVLSDIHYASPAEQKRVNYEFTAVKLRWQRILLRAYRHAVWLRNPFAHNALLDWFLAHAGPAEIVVANGDYSCDSAFVGVSDDAAAESAALCLDRLQNHFGAAFHAVIGDHELGKPSLAGSQGGMRIASWQRATTELGLHPSWRVDLGPWTLLGLTSTLLALPVLAPEIPAHDMAAWNQLRTDHCREIGRHLDSLEPDRRLLLFLHDPTALPFLADLPAMRTRMRQVAATVIGHLHSPLVLWKSRLLAGVPPISRLGHAVRRMTHALHHARSWGPFNVHLCPSLAGLELLKDGGFLEIDLSYDPDSPPVIRRRRVPRIPSTNTSPPPQAS